MKILIKKSQLWKVKTSLPLVPFWHSQQLPAFWSLELRWNYLTSGLQSSPHHTLLPELGQSCQIQPCNTMHTNMSYQEDTRYHVLINCVILALCKKELDMLSLELLEQYPVAAMLYSHTIKSGIFLTWSSLEGREFWVGSTQPVHLEAPTIQRATYSINPQHPEQWELIG
jgi:hypothetical protein